jgi:3-isopropylmalate/(R)-2-methylmalate dehydratase small subunit
MDGERYRVRRISGEISTDDIIPARYKHMYTDPAQLSPHVFENRFPGLAATFRDGDALVGADIVGIGSSREQAVSALVACGVRLVVAPEFGRIFYRNCWNLGLPAVEADPSAFAEGQLVGVDLARGVFLGEGNLPAFRPPAAMMIDMVRAGGLLPLIFGGGSTTRDG